MSEENRNGRRGNDPRGASHQRPPTAYRDGNPNSFQARRGGKSGSSMSMSTNSFHNGLATQNTHPEEHISIAGFNYDAITAVLQQGYDAKAPLYKPEAKTQPSKPESPWGLKPGAMASGKDFWIDLRKQVAALQQTGGTSQGG